MKDVPDIAPEVRGLLEEIVADPRSSMRLVPRKALRSWFDTGETARAGEVSTTRAERHLIEEHRESLAALLCEAAWIAYWKAPVLVHRPVGTDGCLYHPTERETSWKVRVERYSRSHPASGGNATLLSECMTGLRADRAHDFAQASLGLVPSDRTRCYVALTLPWSRPRSAARFFRLLSESAYPAELRPLALLSLAQRVCATEQFREARDLYRAHASADSSSPYGPLCSLALSCVLGERSTAALEAQRLASVVAADDARLEEGVRLLRQWKGSLSGATLATARQIARELGSEAGAASRVFEP